MSKPLLLRSEQTRRRSPNGVTSKTHFPCTFIRKKSFFKSEDTLVECLVGDQPCQRHALQSQKTKPSKRDARKTSSESETLSNRSGFSVSIGNDTGSTVIDRIERDCAMKAAISSVKTISTSDKDRNH